LLLNCFHLQLKAQVKHEVKLSTFQIFALNLHPTYELISKNEKFGIEVGTGIDFSKSRFAEFGDSTVTTILGPTSFIIDKYKQREWKSSLALKYYWYFNLNEKYISVFVGPYIKLDRVVFLEDEYIERRAERASMDEDVIPEFIGQREISPGIIAGGKMIFKNNLVLELSTSFMLLYEEEQPNNINMKPTFFYAVPSLKVGYRFGAHPITITPE